MTGRLDDMTEPVTRPVIAGNDLDKLLLSLTPFRTEARSGKNHRQYEDGPLAAYTAPRMAFSGGYAGPTSLEVGLLVDRFYDEFMKDWIDGVIDYVVYSYDTIISWHTKDGKWQVTDSLISAKTAKHQIRILLALKQQA